MKFKISIFYLLLSFVSVAQTPNWQWAKSYGSTAAENASGIATDNIGNSYVCGYYYSSTLAIGSGTLSNYGNYDSYISKYDNSGNVLWAKSFGGIYDDNATDVAIDASGNVYVTGYFISPQLICGSFTLTNSSAGDLFIIKYDTNGNLVWAKNYGDGGGSCQANSITTDLSGNVFLSGFYNSATLTFGTYTLTNNGNDDAFVTKLNSSGTVAWANSFGNNFSDVANGVSCDASGNVFITGYFKSGILTAGTSTLINSSVASADIFIIKLNNSGNVMAANSAGDMFDDVGTGITCDNSGNVILTGYYFSPSLTIGTSTLTNYGNRDVITVKCNNSCNFLWARGAGGNSDDYGYGIKTDAAGNIYVNGHNHSFLFTHGTYTVSMAGGVGDGFLSAYSSAGTALWLDGVGGGGDEGWNAMGIDGAGNLYCAGYFASSSVTIGTSNLSSAGSADLLVAKLSTVNSVNEINSIIADFVIYPNPSNGEVFVSHAVKSEWIRCEVFNSTGQLIYIRESAEGTLRLNLYNEVKGIYFIRISSGKNYVTKKLILY